MKIKEKIQRIIDVNEYFFTAPKKLKSRVSMIIRKTDYIVHCEKTGGLQSHIYESTGFFLNNELLIKLVSHYRRSEQCKN